VAARFLSLTRGRVARTLRQLAELALEHRLANRDWAQTHAARVVNLLGDLLEIGWMSEMAARHMNNDATCALLTSLAGYHLLPDENSFEHPVLEALKRTANALIDETRITIEVGAL